MPRRKVRPQRASTDELILEAAERLFARYGLDGVSLRQIGAAAGSLNSSAVQYHFGSKAKLVRAIFERRLPVLEVERAKLLALAKRENLLNDPRALLSVILLPIAEARDRDGRRSYAAFLLRMRQSEGAMGPRLDAADLSPLTSHVSELLAAAAAHMPAEAYRRRFRFACDIFLSELMEADRRDAGGAQAPPEDQRLADVLDIAVAALLAPVVTRDPAAMQSCPLI
jgi:AcrR family transcriptional regulator